jgi:hypothetical protein
MIYSDSETCRFCSATVDRQVAAAGSELQSRVNTACNQAKLLRNAAGVMWIFFLLGLLPFLPFGWGIHVPGVLNSRLAGLLADKVWWLANYRRRLQTGKA